MAATKKQERRDIDRGKVEALYAAGWRTEKIAEELGIAADTVKDILQRQRKGTKKEECQKAEKPDTQKIVVLTDGELRGIYEKAATIGAKEALKAFKEERKKEYSHRADKRLRNTKLLLRNYHMLKEHAEKSVFGRTQMEESATDILESMMSMYDNEVIIESIKRSATRTAVIVSHIETMFDLYAAYCDRSTNRDIDMRRYEVVWDMYMAEDTLSAKEIAAKQHISKETVYSDLRMAIERLTALIFGVDGLNVQ